MSKTTRFAVLAIFCFVGGLAQAADVSGTWTASFNTQVGQQSYTYLLKVEGSSLTGTAKSNVVGDTTLSEGKVDGNRISFVEKASFQGMPITFNYTGEIVSDDEIRFKRELIGFPGPEEFVAKRSK